MQRVGNVKRQQRRYAGTSCPCCMHPVIRLRSMRLCDTCHTLQPCCPTEGLQGLYDQDRIACCRSCWQAVAATTSRAGCRDVPSSSMAPATFSSSSTASSRSSIFFTLLNYMVLDWRHGEQWDRSRKHYSKQLQWVG